MDGVFVIAIEYFNYCFDQYYVGLLRDSEGYVRTWYDQKSYDNIKKIYTFSPKAVNGDIYVTVEGYPF